MPRGESSRFSGCTSNSFAASNVRCFCVETTVPTTRAICIHAILDSRFWVLVSWEWKFRPTEQLALDVPVVNDADDSGVDWRFYWMKRKARFLATHEEHFFPHSGAN